MVIEVYETVVELVASILLFPKSLFLLYISFFPIILKLRTRALSDLFFTKY
jgi:hypothetical protein